MVFKIKLERVFLILELKKFKSVRKKILLVEFLDRLRTNSFSSFRLFINSFLKTNLSEALDGAIGFKATKQIYVELATPKTTYDQAITKVTGVKIVDWNVILQRYVDSVKENKAWSLEKLQSEYQAKKSK